VHLARPGGKETTMYTPEKVQELLAAQDALARVPQGQDYTAERARLTLAEQALVEEGWQNLESREQLEALAAK
jgi:hypothetical protein